MYKLKIINFKPYEYKIFEEKLNQLGQQGYKTDDLSLLTIFKKTKQKYYYHIDFHIPEGKSRNEKNLSKQKFFDPYLDKEYEAIYNKNNMYVFIGEQKLNKEIDIEQKKDYVDDKKTLKFLNGFISSLVMTFTFLILSFMAITIDTFLSYGATVLFISIILACITTIYRCLCNFYFMNQLKKMLHHKPYNLSSSLLKKLRKVYLGLFVLVIIGVIGGLAEDTLSAQSFSIQEHPTLLLKDLGVKAKTELSTMKRSSFTVPSSYTSLEIGEDNSTLYIKQYNLRNVKAATQLMKDFSQHPEQYYCTSVKADENILYGYSDDDLMSLIIQREKTVTIISPGIHPDNEITQKIIDFYS